MKLKRLLSVLDVCECTADPELDVRDISFDSRTTQPGDLFAAGGRYTVYPRGRQPPCAVTHLL